MPQMDRLFDLRHAISYLLQRGGNVASSKCVAWCKPVTQLFSGEVVSGQLLCYRFFISCGGSLSVWCRLF